MINSPLVKTHDTYSDLADSLNEIKQNLDKLNVPADTNLWKRVQFYAQHYPRFTGVGAKPIGEVVPVAPKSVDEMKASDIKEIKLSEDQEKAWKKIKVWASNNDPYFRLEGAAGTGKSFLLKKAKTDIKRNFYFTAPTNKATKVLKNMLGVKARTIYSLLGLRMVESEEDQKLEYPKKMPDIAPGSIIVIDEASMIDKELFKFIDTIRQACNLKIMYVGDSLQINPVNEDKSPVWRMSMPESNFAKLRKVMRFDNEILNLSKVIRKRLRNKSFDKSPIKNDHSDDEGVFLLDKYKFDKKLLKMKKTTDFHNTKVVAWRNKIVDEYNEAIRNNLGLKGKFAVGDILMMKEPVEEDNIIVASIDDEGTITEVADTVYSIEGEKVPIYNLVVKFDNKALRLRVPKENDDTLRRLLNKLAEKAKKAKPHARYHEWQVFWRVKRSFHSVRYAYALTAHRVQGSTLHTVFLDQRDILINRNKEEAYRALYVGATRPTKCLYTF